MESTQALDAELAAVMKIDPLASAEELSGLTVEAGGLGFAMGLGMVQAKASMMRALLSARDDVWAGMPLDDYRRIIEAYGFELVLEVPFAGNYGDERFFCYAHREGLLLKFDTYENNRVNSGDVYYCWKKTSQDAAWLLSSGHWLGPDYQVFVGHHDTREALIFNLDRLGANGDFVTPWPERGFLWLLHYADAKIEGYDYEAINEARLAMMPEWVREMVGARS